MESAFDDSLWVRGLDTGFVLSLCPSWAGDLKSRVCRFRPCVLVDSSTGALSRGRLTRDGTCGPPEPFWVVPLVGGREVSDGQDPFEGRLSGEPQTSRCMFSKQGNPITTSCVFIDALSPFRSVPKSPRPPRSAGHGSLEWVLGSPPPVSVEPLWVVSSSTSSEGLGEGAKNSFRIRL